MKLDIPDYIRNLQEKYVPYLKFDDDKGYVLSSDAPKEVVEAKEEADKWFKEHNKDYYQAQTTYKEFYKILKIMI